MTSLELQKKWYELKENPSTNSFRSLRISPDCICELYVGINKEGNRCLILILPNNTHLNFKGIKKDKLSLVYFNEKKLLVLQLTDIDFKDLFDDLIVSLHNGIKGITEVDAYSYYFIQAFYRWSDFFEDSRTDILSEAVIQGIMGELLVLKMLILQQEGPDINYLLKAWTGPYDKGNDFELENKNLEVKTKSPNGIDIKISSEFQLEVLPGKGLELVVISLLTDNKDGIHIGDLILQIKKLVQELNGDITILWKALSQKNINPKSLNLYDKYRFKPINWTSYNIADHKFPKLNRSNIPEEISGVKYILRTNLLTPFIILHNKF